VLLDEQPDLTLGVSAFDHGVFGIEIDSPNRAALGSGPIDLLEAAVAV
jgi:hypothetical protein